MKAEQIKDIAPEPFSGSTIEELLAHLHTNNLRFNEAGENGEKTYMALFRQMLGYYYDVQTRSAQLAFEEGRLQEMNTHISKLERLEAGIESSDLEQVLMLRAVRDALVE